MKVIKDPLRLAQGEIMVSGYPYVEGRKMTYAVSPMEVWRAISAAVPGIGVGMEAIVRANFYEDIKMAVEPKRAMGKKVILDTDEALRLLGLACGLIMWAHEGKPGYRVQYSECPYPAYELQRALDGGRWDIIDIWSAPDWVQKRQVYDAAMAVVKAGRGEAK